MNSGNQHETVTLSESNDQECIEAVQGILGCVNASPQVIEALLKVLKAQLEAKSTLKVALGRARQRAEELEASLVHANKELVNPVQEIDLYFG